MEHEHIFENLTAEITPSPFRRTVAVSVLLMLGGLLVYLAFSNPPETIYWQLFLLVVGLGAVFLSDKLRRSTALHILFENDVITDSSGRELCKLSEIAEVERGAFAFKPSNGFLIRLHKPKPRVWAPGLWWGFGRKIGVGGVVPASQSKFMAEMIALRLASLKGD